MDKGVFRILNAIRAGFIEGLRGIHIGGDFGAPQVMKNDFAALDKDAQSGIGSDGGDRGEDAVCSAAKGEKHADRIPASTGFVEDAFAESDGGVGGEDACAREGMVRGGRFAARVFGDERGRVAMGIVEFFDFWRVNGEDVARLSEEFAPPRRRGSEDKPFESGRR